jgi:hypothetical protein
MKHFLFSFIVFVIAFFGFIVLPLFIFGISGKGVEQFKWTEEGRLASAKIEKMHDSGGPTSFQELEQLQAVINSQEKIHYSFSDIFKIGQDKLIWLSWVPVFIGFVFFSKYKSDLIYFWLIVLTVFLADTLSLKTMICFMAASLAGYLLRKMKPQEKVVVN